MKNIKILTTKDEFIVIKLKSLPYEMRNYFTGGLNHVPNINIVYTKVNPVSKYLCFIK